MKHGKLSMKHVVVIVPNWNGAQFIESCLRSLLAQTLEPHIVVIDNGSVDNSTELIERQFPMVELIKHDTNKGYAGGINPGFRRAIEIDALYAAPFNNDAIADPTWLKTLVDYMDLHPNVGIAAPKLLDQTRSEIDTTGEEYTVWGLPYPRGRGEKIIDTYDTQQDILGASGGASVYRVSMLRQIGLFDGDFFAYYEDVDLSLRGQLAGWSIRYVPRAIVRHATSTTGQTIKGFFAMQTVKNLPWLLVKNIPFPYCWSVVPRLFIAECSFIGRAVVRGHGWYAFKGLVIMFYKLPTKLQQRRIIQRTRILPPVNLWERMRHDLPPQAYALRRLRATWWQLTGRKS